jgi:hypothetical protein
MNSEFTAILQKLIAEQGKETLLNHTKCKALLADYTRNDFKKESRLLLQVLDAGVQKAIDSAENITICKKQQIRLLREDYFFAEEIAKDVVDTLASVLLGDTAGTETQNAGSAREQAKEVLCLKAHAGGVGSVAYSPNGKYFASGAETEPSRYGKRRLVKTYRFWWGTATLYFQLLIALMGNTLHQELTTILSRYGTRHRGKT